MGRAVFWGHSDGAAARVYENEGFLRGLGRNGEWWILQAVQFYNESMPL